MRSEIVAVCISKTKGTNKNPVDSGFCEVGVGLVGDAHAGSPREVSLLAIESVVKMNTVHRTFNPGDFAENITTQGMVITALPIGTCLKVGTDAVLEITQIGKKCHTGCAIYKEFGKCVMPGEGVFAKVVHSGSIKAGDTIKVISE